MVEALKSAGGLPPAAEFKLKCYRGPGGETGPEISLVHDELAAHLGGGTACPTRGSLGKGTEGWNERQREFLVEFGDTCESLARLTILKPLRGRFDGFSRI